MKKTFLFLSLFMFLCGHSQISKTIHVTTQGDLSTLLTDDEKNTVTNLTVTGTIDVRDIKCMRDQMAVLAILDLSAANIAAYSGGAVTHPSFTTYPSNEMPAYSFRNPYTAQSKSTLTSVKLPNSLLSIGQSAFSVCSGLKSINIGNSVETINTDAFYTCYELETVEMGDGLKSIGYSAFDNCSKLVNLTLGKNLTTIGPDAFSDCTSLINVVIPNSVTTVQSSAFSYCSSLTTLTIGSSVSSIEVSAFSACSNIKTIYSLNPSPPGVNLCFSGVTSVRAVYVPATSVSAYKNASGWSDSFYAKIIANPVSSSPVITESKVKVYISNSELNIDGTFNGEILSIYTLNGKLVKSIKSLGDKITIPDLSKNFYLVKTKNETFKVIF